MTNGKESSAPDGSYFNFEEVRTEIVTWEYSKVYGLSELQLFKSSLIRTPTVMIFMIGFQAKVVVELLDTLLENGIPADSIG